MIEVLLPFYGDPELMRTSVRSVLRQSSPDWRLIVVDDAYPDPSIASWFAELDDPRVEYHRNAENLGANRNYTKAVGLARAEHVVIMGADDVMLPNYLDVVDLTLRRFPTAAAVQCGVEVIDAHGAPIRPLVDRVKHLLQPQGDETCLLSGEQLIVSLLRGNWTYFPSLCWRRDAIAAVGFRPEFEVVQDLALLIDVLTRGGGLAYVPRTAFRYRRHVGSDSARKTEAGGARFLEEKRYFSSIAAELHDKNMHRAARAARVHLTSRAHAAALIPRATRSGDAAAARDLWRHACMP